MKLIFQIAAGVIIAILVTNILLARKINSQMEQAYEGSRHHVKLLNGVNITETMVERYLRNHHKLPRYVSDLSCNKRGFSCPVVATDGAFYMVEGEHWVRQALRLEGEKVKADCTVTDKSLTGRLARYWEGCTWVEKPVTPVFLSARIPCASANRKHEKRICQSDRLVAADWAVENAYQAALARSDESRKPLLISAQKQKLKFELSDCKDDACIESVLWQRHAELQAY